MEKLSPGSGEGNCGYLRSEFCGFESFFPAREGGRRSRFRRWHDCYGDGRRPGFRRPRPSLSLCDVEPLRGLEGLRELRVRTGRRFRIGWERMDLEQRRARRLRE